MQIELINLSLIRLQIDKKYHQSLEIELDLSAINKHNCGTKHHFSDYNIKTLTANAFF